MKWKPKISIKELVRNGKKDYDKFLDEKNDKIFLAGHNGLVGSAILKNLRKNNYKYNYKDKNSSIYLIKKVEHFLKKNKPKIVIIAAAKVGGIKANNLLRADFIRENLQIQTNIIHASHLSNINNIIFLGSSCVYPKSSKLPIKESYLMTGLLEKLTSLMHSKNCRN